MDRRYQELARIIQDATQLATTLSSLSEDTASRQSLIEAARRLTRALQTPTDRAWEDIFSQPHHLAALRIALDAGWLASIAKAGPNGISADDLAERSGAEVALVARTMRLLSAAGDVKEVGYKRYPTTEIVELFMTPGYSGGLRHASDEYATTLARMPEYLRERGYKEPTKPGDGPYAYVHGGSIFSVMKGGRLEAFHEILGAIRKRSWLDVYPFQQLQVDEKDSILLVDVGGANGHELKHHAGRRKALGLPRSRLVLQDLPRVTEKIPLEWRQDFEVIDHDFFTPQPEGCRGARAYYMRYM